MHATRRCRSRHLLALMFAAPAMLVSGSFAGEANAPGLVTRSTFDLLVSPTLIDDAERVAERIQQRFDRLAERFGPGEWQLRPRLHCFASHEEQGLVRGTATSFSVTDAEATFVIEPGVARQDGKAEALLFLNDRFGPPATLMAADGAAYALADEDAVKDYRASAAWLAAAGEATELADLLDPERYLARSVLVQAPLAAVVMELLLERVDHGDFLAVWRGEPIDATALAIAYRERLDALVTSHRHWMDERRRARADCRQQVELRGISFAHEGYRIHDGYVSGQAARSLARASELGAGAVSITPFGSFRALTDPAVRFATRSDRSAGRETDESVLVAANHAARLSMRRMLKPHLWGHGGWCGDVRMQNEADWHHWFASYGEFLVHHAMLAERAGLEWLSIGCELAGTTEGHDAEWAELARRARRLFAGGLIYSSNWGDEMDRLGFAAELDAVGVDFYFPLSATDTPTDAELLEAARAALLRTGDLATRYRRPVILTELGYPPVAAPWKEPFRGDGGAAGFAENQARCYRIFAQAWQSRPPDAVRGFLIWKWPTFDRWDAASRLDYWPAGEGTLTALRQLFALR